MSRIKILIESIFGGLAAAVYGAFAGAVIAALASVTYFVVRLLFSLRGYSGAESGEVLAVIESAVALGAKLLVVLPIVGAALMFLRAFGQIFRRRISFNAFLRR